MSPIPRTVYVGTLVHIPSPTSLHVRTNAIAGVDQRGTIVFLKSRDEGADGSGVSESEWIEREVKRCGWGRRRDVGGGREEGGWELVRAGEGEFWFPGFVDTHIHAPQYPNSGIFGQSTLLDWLQKYTFPLESSLSSLPKAHAVYTRCIAATLRHGTTTAAYYATIHTASTNLLASICLAAGQRAFIGRCAMDSDINPDYYRDASSTAAIAETQKTIAHMAAIDPNRTLISPIITPRFAPSCSPALLSALGALAHDTALPIQTHISENPAECELVASMFPSCATYAAVYDFYRLLTPRTVLAHGVHLSADERALIKQRGAKVSHCPVSNSCISSGLCPVRKLLDAGIDVGLGTDVSGGWSPSVLIAAREAATVSRVLASVERDFGDKKKNVKAVDDAKIASPENKEGAAMKEHERGEKDSEIPPQDHDRSKLSVEECLHLATVGGARCLGLEDQIGRFEVGMQWDAQLVRLGSSVDFDVEVDLYAQTKNSHAMERDSTTNTAADNIMSDAANTEGAVAKGWADPGKDKGGLQEDHGPVQLWGTESWEEKIAKWVYGGDDRNTIKVWVAGRLVHQRL